MTDATTWLTGMVCGSCDESGAGDSAMSGAESVTTAEQRAANLQAEIDAYRAGSGSLAFELA